MGGGGGTTTTQSNRPELLPEARQGFQMGQDFYQNILSQPPVFSGKRLADPTHGIYQSIGMGYNMGEPSAIGNAANQQLYDTLSGSYLSGPMGQWAVESLAAPIFRQYQSEVLPGIRDRAVFAGHGLSGDRRGVAEQNAQDSFAEALARGAFFPVFDSERGRQMEGIEASQRGVFSDIARIAQVLESGRTHRGLEQDYLNMAREIFEEPLFRQSGAADMLLSSGVGPVGSMSTSRSRESADTGSQIMSGLMTAAMLYMAFSHREMKEDIELVVGDSRELMVEEIRQLPISTWRYRHERSSTRHIGPMWEDLPDYMRTDLGVNIASVVGALIVTVQDLMDRLEKLEKKSETDPNHE